MRPRARGVDTTSRDLTRSFALPRVTLRKRLARAIRGGHPWIYREALAGTPRLADGALVLVADGDGRPLARGFWDAHSPIAVRVLGDAGASDLAGEIDRRIAAALARRLSAIDRSQTSAFRWIHGEADALPGVHADVYGRALSFRCVLSADPSSIGWHYGSRAIRTTSS